MLREGTVLGFSVEGGVDSDSVHCSRKSVLLAALEEELKGVTEIVGSSLKRLGAPFT